MRILQQAIEPHLAAALSEVGIDDTSNLASLLQRVEVECFEKSLRELDDDLVTSVDDFARDVYKLSSHGGCVAGHRDHVPEDVFLKRLEQEEGEKHRVVERLVLSEPFEWKLFEAKVFKGAVREFLSSALMVGFDDPLWFEHPFALFCRKMLQDAWVRAQVGEDHVIRSEELEIHLRPFFVAPRACIEGPPELSPACCPVTELHVVPDLAHVVVLAPG